MVRSPYFYLVVLCCHALASPAGAQAQVTFPTGRTVALPAIGQGGADHSAVAINQRGDVFVAWHASRTTSLGSPKQVEGVLVRYCSTLEWRLPSLAEVLLLGDPTLGLLPGPGEACRKPDVTALGDDFVVVWPRSDDLGNSRLEAAYIQVPASGPPIVHQLAPGEGYLLDATAAAGDAGLMPDLVARASKGPLVAGTFYVHETLSQNNRREYDLRYVEVDFAVLPPPLPTPQTVTGTIPVDDAVGTPVTGGRVLPDALEDDFGNVVVAYEEFAIAGHLGFTTDTGRVWVRRYSDAGGLLSEMDNVTLSGPRAGSRQRRPNLAASRRDPTNTVSIAWFETPNGTGDVDSFHVQLDLPGGGTPGQQIQTTSLTFPNHPSRHDNHPIPIHSSVLRVCLAVRSYPLSKRMISWSPLPPATLSEVMSPVDPWRPAIDLLEVTAPGTFGLRLAPICYEGLDPGSGYTRIYLMVQRS